MYLIIHCFMISAHLSSVRVHNLYIYIYSMVMKFRFPYANQFLGTSVKRQQLSRVSLLSVTVAANQLIN